MTFLYQQRGPLLLSAKPLLSRAKLNENNVYPCLMIALLFVAREEHPNCNLISSPPQKKNINAQSNTDICSDKQSNLRKQNNTEISLGTHTFTHTISHPKRMTQLYRQKQRPPRVTLINFKNFVCKF